ncbi:MAG: restriction endonuclease subunit R, partial [Hymenobacter sp.]
IKNQEKEQTFGLDRKKQMPFFRIFKAELFDNRTLTEDEIAQNVNLTQHVFHQVATEIKLTGFWDSTPAQAKLRGELQKLLLSPEFIKTPNITSKYKELVSRIMELAKTNHFKITRD